MSEPKILTADCAGPEPEPGTAVRLDGERIGEILETTTVDGRMHIRMRVDDPEAWKLVAGGQLAGLSVGRPGGARRPRGRLRR